MLAIRMQRTGRKGHAHFRVVVQDSRWSAKSGKVVAQLGSYDPHTKTTTLIKDQAETYLKNGAQPSARVAALLKSEGVKLPKWVDTGSKKKGKIRNPEKLRANRPAGVEAPAEKPTDEPKPETTDDSVVEAPEAEAVAQADQAEDTPESEAQAEVKEEPAAEQETEAKNEEETKKA